MLLRHGVSILRPMMNIPPGVTLKVDRAVYHIKELETATKRYLDSNPHSVVRKTDPQTGDYSFRLQVHKEIPMAWSAPIGDAVHNLRSALDHLMVELVLANVGTVTDATEFPIFQSLHAYSTKAAGKVMGASQPAIDLIDAAKPYKGGNDGLWLIHKLDIIDKHRALVSAFGAFTEATTVGIRDPAYVLPKWELGAGIRLTVKFAKRCPLHDGEELYRIPASAIGKVDDNPTFKIEIAFNEPGVIECEPIFPLLGDLAELVKSVIMTFDHLFP